MGQLDQSATVHQLGDDDVEETVNLVEIGEFDDGSGAVDVDNRQTGQRAQPAKIATGLHPVTPGADFAQFLCRAIGNHAALVQDDHAVTQPVDEIELMGAEEDRDSLGGLLSQYIGHRVHGHRIESREGLIEDEDCRISKQRCRYLDPLLVTQGQLLHLLAGMISKPEPV